MRLRGVVGGPCYLLRHHNPLIAVGDGGRTLLNNLGLNRNFSTLISDEESEMKDFNAYLDSLKNHEKSGVPKGAGTDSDDGFDLGRMKRLMQSLGNPQSKYKAIHIAGTKGKGSTAAFLSNILRAEGYSVGCYTRYYLLIRDAYRGPFSRRGSMYSVWIQIILKIGIGYCGTKILPQENDLNDSSTLSSPHIKTIRERITLGRSGDPVSAKAVNSLFQRIKVVLDQAVQLEKGHLSHFEVFTALVFNLFAEENVEIAVIEAGLGGARDATNVISSSDLAASVITTIGEEHLAALGGSLESIAIAKSGIIKHGRPVVLGGSYLPHIELILRNKASSMQSSVISVSDPKNNRSTIKGISNVFGIPCQISDIILQQCVELYDVKLRMIGWHQLQNAATATCAALCLRDQGWRISGGSIRAGLERTQLLGRSQFLTSIEAEALGLPGATILLDGAHTKESAKALADMIQITHPKAPLVFVVAMASDKDHRAFARELLAVRQPDAVLLTEVSIAGDRNRTASWSLLKDRWIEASNELGVRFCELGVNEHRESLKDRSARSDEHDMLVLSGGSLIESMKVAGEILGSRSKGRSGILVVTGSLHVVSSILSSLQR
ncbi:hypothetical protein OSB04_026112 [Centaurea solstitialis]|uniref:Mur ligase central domain-containing protein n=1 Tax=Centaurea solstitialis TaxID=347529 RepID=A0AA38SNE5_9ASTR|nr:hypothetical protein OSB04_026112 [Centaurea solstitialis]